MQHPVGAVVACWWPWMGRLDRLDLSGVLSCFLGGRMGRDSTFPNKRQKGEGFNVTKETP